MKTIAATLNQNKQSLSIFVIWLFVVSALIGIGMGYQEWFLPKTPINLIIGAVLLFWNLSLNNLKKLLIWLVAFSVGMGVEIIGVQTGVIFGEYVYGENLGPKLLGVPYLIGVNWAVLSFITAAITEKLIPNRWLSMLSAVLLMVGLDLVLEKLAPVFDFWYFAGGEVPLQNFIAWGIIAFFLQVVIRNNIRINDFKYSLHLFLTQLLFFSCCYLLFQLG